MRESIDAVLNELCEIYEKNKTKALEKYWQIGLEEFQDKNIIKALKGYYKRNESHFLPTPKEFIEFAKDPNPHQHL